MHFMHLAFFVFINCILKFILAAKIENLSEEFHEKLTISSLNDQDILSSFNFTIRSSASIGIFM